MPVIRRAATFALALCAVVLAPRVTTAREGGLGASSLRVTINSTSGGAGFYVCVGTSQNRAAFGAGVTSATGFSLANLPDAGMIKVTVMRAGYQGVERDYYPNPGQSVVLALPITAGSGGFVCPGYTPPSASVIRAISSQSQQGEAAYQAPIKPAVRVLDQYTNPMAGVTVTFSVTQGTGPIAPASVVTGPDGTAALTSWWLSPTAGVNEVTATASGISSPVRFTASGVLTPTALTAVSAQSQQGVAGGSASVPPAVIARDRNANPVSGATVVFTPSAAGGSVFPISVVTGADGIARLTRWTFSSSGLTNTVMASLGQLRVLFSATLLAPAPVTGTIGIETVPAPPPRLGEEALHFHGDPFDPGSKHSCQKFGKNFVLVGLKVMHKITLLTGIDLFCAPLRADGTLGQAIFLPAAATGGYQSMQAVCPSGSAIVGIQGTTSHSPSGIRSLQIYCNKLLATGLASGSTPTRTSPALGIVSGSAWGPDMCTQSRPATAVAFYLSVVVEREIWSFRLFCEQPTRGS